MWLQTVTSFQKISRNWLYLLFFILSRTLICQDLREKWYFEIEVFPKQLFSQETVRHTQECVGCELGMRICAYFFEVGTIFDRDHNKTIELACFFDTNYSNPNWDFFSPNVYFSLAAKNLACLTFWLLLTRFSFNRARKLYCEFLHICWARKASRIFAYIVKALLCGEQKSISKLVIWCEAVSKS